MGVLAGDRRALRGGADAAASSAWPTARSATTTPVLLQLRAARATFQRARSRARCPHGHGAPRRGRPRVGADCHPRRSCSPTSSPRRSSSRRSATRRGSRSCAGTTRPSARTSAVTAVRRSTTRVTGSSSLLRRTPLSIVRRDPAHPRRPPARARLRAAGAHRRPRGRCRQARRYRRLGVTRRQSRPSPAAPRSSRAELRRGALRRPPSRARITLKGNPRPIA